VNVFTWFSVIVNPVMQAIPCYLIKMWIIKRKINFKSPLFYAYHTFWCKSPSVTVSCLQFFHVFHSFAKTGLIKYINITSIPNNLFYSRFHIHHSPISFFVAFFTLFSATKKAPWRSWGRHSVNFYFKNNNVFLVFQ